MHAHTQRHFHDHTFHTDFFCGQFDGFKKHKYRKKHSHCIDYERLLS